MSKGHSGMGRRAITCWRTKYLHLFYLKFFLNHYKVIHGIFKKKQYYNITAFHIPFRISRIAFDAIYTFQVWDDKWLGKSESIIKDCFIKIIITIFLSFTLQLYAAINDVDEFLQHALTENFSYYILNHYNSQIVTF